MTRDELKTLIRDLYFYFRLKTPADSEQIDEWVKDLQFVESKALNFIRNEFKGLDNLPRNIPKKIKEFYAMYRRQNVATAFVKYDKYDDMRFPVEKMQTATELFLKAGEDVFIHYCEAHYMPEQDIERCKNKAKHITSRAMVADKLAMTGEKLTTEDRSGGLLWED